MATRRTPAPSPERVEPQTTKTGGLLRKTLNKVQAVVDKKNNAYTGSVDSLLPSRGSAENPVRTTMPVDPATPATSLPAAAGSAQPAALPQAPATSDLPPEQDADVFRHMTKGLSRNNEYMQQAGAQGLKVANRRGLINSTSAVRAVEAERIRAALPIASQQASQAHQSNMQRRDILSQDRLTRMNLASNERSAAAQLAASFESSYSNMIANIMNNPELPASARERYTRHAGRVRDSNLRLVEQMYGIRLNWGGGGGSRPRPPAPQQPPADQNDPRANPAAV